MKKLRIFQCRFNKISCWRESEVCLNVARLCASVLRFWVMMTTAICFSDFNFLFLFLFLVIVVT